MAKDREPVKHLGPESDPSDEEEEEDDSSEESDSESEPTPAKKPSTSTLKKSPPPPPPQVSSSDEEDEDDSDSDSEGPDPNVKPIASKPMDDPQKPGKKPQSKPAVSEPATASKSTAKRPAEEKELDDGKDSKRSKKKPESENELSAATDSSKRVLFQRIWSEEDEIVILKGMIDYTAKKKSNPVADPDAFLDHIKKDLHVEVNKNQLQDKIKRLKKKYETSKSKGRNFSKPHEMEAFVLSENIWGTEKGKETVAASPKANGSVVKKTASKKANGLENEEGDDDMMSEEVANGDAKEMVLAPMRLRSNGLSVDERVLRIGAELFEGVDGVEGAKEWKNLTIEEMEINIRRLDMMRARTELVLDYLTSKNH